MEVRIQLGRRAALASCLLLALGACEGNRPLRVPPPKPIASVQGPTDAAPAPMPSPPPAPVAPPPPDPTPAASPPPDPSPPPPAPPPPDPVPPPPAPPLCDLMPQKPLPYAIAADFTSPFTLNATFTWTGDAGLVCDRASCSAFHYDPTACVAAQGDALDGGALGDAGGGLADTTVAACWAGVIFTPSGFGQPGICIAPGATAIHFKARASRDGARVKFGAIRAGLGETEFFLALTTAWADYSVAIPAGEDYDNEPSGPSPFGVWNGFSVVAEPEDHLGGTDILVSDVVWVAN